MENELSSVVDALPAAGDVANSHLNSEPITLTQKKSAARNV